MCEGIVDTRESLHLAVPLLASLLMSNSEQNNVAEAELNTAGRRPSLTLQTDDDSEIEPLLGTVSSSESDDKPARMGIIGHIIYAIGCCLCCCMPWLKTCATITDTPRRNAKNDVSVDPSTDSIHSNIAPGPAPLGTKDDVHKQRVESDDLETGNRNALVIDVQGTILHVLNLRRRQHSGFIAVLILLTSQCAFEAWRAIPGPDLIERMEISCNFSYFYQAADGEANAWPVSGDPYSTCPDGQVLVMNREENPVSTFRGFFRVVDLTIYRQCDDDTLGELDRKLLLSTYATYSTNIASIITPIFVIDVVYRTLWFLPHFRVTSRSLLPRKSVNTCSNVFAICCVFMLCAVSALLGVRARMACPTLDRYWSQCIFLGALALGLASFTLSTWWLSTALIRRWERHYLLLCLGKAVSSSSSTHFLVGRDRYYDSDIACATRLSNTPDGGPLLEH